MLFAVVCCLLFVAGCCLVLYAVGIWCSRFFMFGVRVLLSMVRCVLFVNCFFLLLLFVVLCLTIVVF